MEQDYSLRILAHGIAVSNDTRETGLNNNDCIIGASGSGKTRNYVKPNLLQMTGSVAVTDTKGTLADEVGPVLRDHGVTVAPEKEQASSYSKLSTKRNEASTAQPAPRRAMGSSETSSHGQ